MELNMEFGPKFTLCVLLTQQGKTFTAISRIETEIDQDKEYGQSIHFILTMNTLLNNQQFASRLERIERLYGAGSICVFSSKYRGKYVHVKNRLELQGLCADKTTCPRVVVACSNTYRYNDVVKNLSVIDQNHPHICRAFAYYDELHQYITTSLRSQIEQIHALNIVKGILALTATPDTIWEKEGRWSKINLISLEEFSDENYAGFKDMIFNCIDDYFETPYLRPNLFDFEVMDRQTVGYIKHVLTKHPTILDKHTRTFIPAHKRQLGHNMVRDLVFEHDNKAIVIVINGVEKTIQYKELGNIKTIPLMTEHEEVCETISRIILHHHLENRPIVITGLLCVGMGQTLTHPTLGSFTSAIFSHMDLTNDEIYQLFGRITGRMKQWDNYVSTQVYCPTTIMNRCRVMEECARNMACGHNGECVDQTQYREPMQRDNAGQDVINNIRPTKPKKTKKIECEKSTIPIVIQLTEEQYFSIHKNKHSWNIDSIFRVIELYLPELPPILMPLHRIQITESTILNDTYKKRITDLVNAEKNKKKFTISTGQIHVDSYQIFMDKIEKRLIVSIYYGSRG